MKVLVFDTGPLISLAMNNLLWIIQPLKEKFKGEFYITESVKRECIERPLTSKKFKFEALQNLKLVQDGVIRVYHNEDLKDKTHELLKLSNSLFTARGNYIKNVQYAEIETIAAAKMLNAEAIVIDEFITRSLLEDPMSVEHRMKKKLHTHVETDKDNLEKFKGQVKGVRVIRSFELVSLGYEFGFFKDYVLNLPEPKKTLLEGLLWAVKLNGCSVSEQEIKEVMSIEHL